MKAGMSHRKDARDSEFHIDRGRKKYLLAKKNHKFDIMCMEKMIRQVQCI